MKRILNCAILSIGLSSVTTLIPTTAEERPTEYVKAQGKPIKGPKTFNLYKVNNDDAADSDPLAQLESDGKGKIKFVPRGYDHIVSLTLSQVEETLGHCSHPSHDYGFVVLNGRDDGFFEIRFVFKRSGGAKNQIRPKEVNFGSSWGRVGPKSEVVKYQVINYHRGMSDWASD